MKLGAIYVGEKCVVPRVWQASRFWERMRGLLGRAPLQADEGMLIRDCGMVHTVGMGYALDVVFIDKKGVVRKLVRDLAPRRMAGAFGAVTTLELASGSAAQLGLQVGDAVRWKEVQA